MGRWYNRTKGPFTLTDTFPAGLQLYKARSKKKPLPMHSSITGHLPILISL